MKIFKVLGAAALVGSMAASASALTTTCTFKKEVSFLLETSQSVACETGNDTNTIDSDYVMFGKKGWVLQDKTDEPKGGDPAFTKFTAGSISQEVDGITFDWGGEWKIAGTSMPEQIVITLKQSTGFAAFLLSTNALPQSGTWATNDGSLSHASVYTVGVVPLPASSVLLLGVMGAGGVAAWRKSRRAA
jgi:hypothetical protein